MKNYFLNLIFIFCVLFASAQKNSVYPIGDKIRISSSDQWGILFSYGMINFNGDIKQYDFRTDSENNPDFDELRYAYNIGVRRKISKGLIELSFSKGEMAGLKRYKDDDNLLHTRDEIYDPYNNFDGNGEKFQNQFIEFNAAYLHSLNELNIFTALDIFLKAGTGLNIYTAQKKDLHTNEHIYSYGYEDDVNGINKNSWTTAPITSIFTLGIVGEYEISNDLNLSLETTYKISIDDSWDATLVGENDSYYYFGIGIAYDVFD